jgi:hypothetical protein
MSDNRRGGGPTMKVRWRRYKTVRGLMDSVRRDVGGTEPFRGDHPLVRELERNGMHACVIHSSPPLVRYWHDGKRPPEELAFMLGHELGHVSGKPKRNDEAEEDRADEYGLVARAVLRRMRADGLLKR